MVPLILIWNSLENVLRGPLPKASLGPVTSTGEEDGRRSGPECNKISDFLTFGHRGSNTY